MKQASTTTTRCQNSGWQAVLSSHVPGLLSPHLYQDQTILSQMSPAFEQPPSPNSSNDPCTPTHQTLEKISALWSRSGLTSRRPPRKRWPIVSRPLAGVTSNNDTLAWTDLPHLPKLVLH